MQEPNKNKEIIRKLDAVTNKIAYSGPDSKSSSKPASPNTTSESKFPKQQSPQNIKKNGSEVTAQPRKLYNSPCIRNNRNPNNTSAKNIPKSSPGIRKLSPPAENKGKLVDNNKCTNLLCKPKQEKQPATAKINQAIKPNLVSARGKQLAEKIKIGGIQRRAVSGGKEREAKSIKILPPKTREVSQNSADKGERVLSTLIQPKANNINLGKNQKKVLETERVQDIYFECGENAKVLQTHQDEPKIKMNDPISQEREKLISYNKQCKEMKNIIYIDLQIYGDVHPTTLDYYKFVRLIGKGAFGKVTLGIHKLTGKYVAIKTIDKCYMKDEISRKKVFQEVYILKKIRHANVIRLLEVFEGPKHMLIVMEYAGGGDLLKYIKTKGPLKEPEARTLFRQIIYGIGHIHSRHILHRDIKLDNILLDVEGGVKICDFGVSKLASKAETIKEQCGTPAYIAPEVINDEGYNGFYIDHWSLGVLLYAMICADVPFKAQNMKELLEVITTTPVPFNCPISENAKDLILGLLKIDPCKRLSIPEILSHPWMKEDSTDDIDENCDVFMGSKECGNPAASESSPNINTIDVSNLFFREQGKERLCYSDYCYISNDLYTHRIEEEYVRIIESFGYTRQLLIKGLQSGELNHATATYNLLVLP